MAEYPQLNFCPQCGTPLEDREAFGRVRRYCPACDLFVFRDPKVAAAVLVEQDGKVLLVRKAYGRAGCWSLPAGFVEYDEDPAAAAVRECLEETGLEVELTGILDILPGAGPPGEASFTIVYRGKIVGGLLRAGDDADRVGFFSVDNLPPLAYESTRQALARWQDLEEASAQGH